MTGRSLGRPGTLADGDLIIISITAFSSANSSCARLRTCVTTEVAALSVEVDSCFEMMSRITDSKARKLEI